MADRSRGSLSIQCRRPAPAVKRAISGRRLLVRVEHAAPDLVELDRFEEGTEIALAETLVALALDDLEEDRPDHRRGEDLQQQPGSRRRRAIDQDAVAAQTLKILAMAGEARVHLLIIGVRHVHEGDALAAQPIDRTMDVARGQGDVLDALAAIGLQVLGDLRALVGALVDGDADLAARAGHRLGAQARQLALDVEITHLAEIEEPLVEARPTLHTPLVDIVRKVVDGGEPDAGRPRLGAGYRYEIDVVDGVLAIAIDEIDQAAADPLDGGDIELHRPDLAGNGAGALRKRAATGLGRVAHAKGDGADRRSVQPREGLGEAPGLGVDDEIDVALAIEGHVFGAMPRRRDKAHALEQTAEFRRVGRGIFDELEAVGAHRIFPQHRPASPPICPVSLMPALRCQWRLTNNGYWAHVVRKKPATVLRVYSPDELEIEGVRISGRASVRT